MNNYYTCREEYDDRDYTEVLGSSEKTEGKVFRDIIYNQNKVSKYSCTTHACCGLFSDITGLKLAEHIRHLIWERQIQEGANPFKGDTFINAIKTFCKSFKTIFDTKIVYYRVSLNEGSIKSVIDSGSSCLIGYYGKLGKDARDDGIINNKEHKKGGGHCVLPGAFVFSNKGIESIDNVVGDKLMSDDGVLNDINNRQIRNFKGDIYKIKPVGSVTTSFTGEHPIKIFRKPSKNTGICQFKEKGTIEKYISYINADEIKLGDYVIMPKNDKVIESDITLDLAELLAYYIADGNLKSDKLKNGKIAYRGVRFCMNSDYQDRIDNVIRLIERCFGVTPAICKLRGKNIHIILYGTKYTDVFAKYGGTPKNKFISKEILFLDKDKQERFIDGYLNSDGYPARNELFTGDKHIAVSLGYILDRIGYSYRVSEYKQPEYGFILGRQIKNNKPIIYTIGFKKGYEKANSFEYNNNIFKRIKKIEIEQYHGNVFNFEINNNHTYCVNNFATHNCIRIVKYYYEGDKFMIKYCDNYEGVYDYNIIEVDFNKYKDLFFKNMYYIKIKGIELQ